VTGPEGAAAVTQYRQLTVHRLQPHIVDANAFLPYPWAALRICLLAGVLDTSQQKLDWDMLHWVWTWGSRTHLGPWAPYFHQAQHHNECCVPFPVWCCHYYAKSSRTTSLHQFGGPLLSPSSHRDAVMSCRRALV
jgi:hypothetical protein